MTDRKKLKTPVARVLCYNCHSTIIKDKHCIGCAWLSLEGEYCQDILEIDEKVNKFLKEKDTGITLGERFDRINFWNNSKENPLKKIKKE